MHPSSSTPMPSSAASRHDWIALRDQVVAFAEVCASPRLLVDDTLMSSAYASLAQVAHQRASVDDWMRRLLEERSRELEQRLELVTARLAEGGRKARRGDDLVALLDHRAGPRVIEVDVRIVSPALATASVVLALGDHPLPGSRQTWWVREDGEWKATDIGTYDAVGSAAVGGTAQAADRAERHRWVLSDGIWEDTWV